jgi:hypothetical protein
MIHLGFLRRPRMNKTTGNRGPRRAAALAVVAAVAVLAAACSSAPSSDGSTTTQEYSLAQCMRSHGVPDFPDPNPAEGFSASSFSSNGANGTVDLDSSQVQKAYGSCRHLLADSPNLSQLQQQIQQLQQKEQQKEEQELPVLLKYSQCMQSHGEPDFPDPPGSGQTTVPKGSALINPQSPQYLAAANACRQLLPAGLQIHLGSHASKGSSGP